MYTKNQMSFRRVYINGDIVLALSANKEFSSATEPCRYVDMNMFHSQAEQRCCEMVNSVADDGVCDITYKRLDVPRVLSYLWQWHCALMLIILY